MPSTRSRSATLLLASVGVLAGAVVAARGAAAAEFIYPQGGPCRTAFSAGHAAIDVAGGTGSPVVAARAGRVTFYGAVGALGNLMVVTHENGYATYYARLGRAERPVGATVRAGAPIAREGATGGGERGRHLHFEIRRYGLRLRVPAAAGATLVRGRAIPFAYPGLAAREPRAVLADVVVPNLETATAFRQDLGDNLVRMGIARRTIGLALDLLALPSPERARAAMLLRSPAVPILESAPAYRRVRAANPHVFGQTRLGAARDGLATAIARLGPSPAPSTGAATPPDVAGALRLLRSEAIPQLEASSAFRDATGDNPARMRIVRGAIDLAIDILALQPAAATRAADAILAAAIPILEGSPGWRRTRAANPLAFDRTRLAAARRALDGAVAKLVAPPAPPAPAPLPVPAPAAHWLRAGIFAVTAGNFSPGLHGDIMAQNGFGWVAIQIHDGLAVKGDNEAACAAGWIAEFRRRGILVGAWGVNRTDPEGEAALASQLVRRFGFSFYIANAEIEHKYTQADGSGSGEAYGRSRRFVAAFRALEPSIPAAVSSYGRADRADIDWAAWRAGGFVFLPQVYWNEHDIYEPVACLDGAVAAGWPRSHVFPTLGIWGGGQRAVVPAAEYAARLQGTGTVGFSVYVGDQIPLPEWPVLGGAVAAGLAR